MSDISIEEIKEIVALQLGIHTVAEHDRLMEDLDAESADVANIIAAVEEKYHIVVKESEIARIFTPADLLELVEKKVV
ncbi:MAG: phosphopantetheine-binding protein [Chloroflexota bacterium]|nr:phosphopantetheine-binding protein [Chloroflexota bacterium]